MVSLKSKLRGKLMSSHGARKNTNNTIWVTYSAKLNRDIALASNSECIYWAACLEVNPQIKSFEFGCIVDLKAKTGDEFRKNEMIRIELADGGLEFHGLSGGDGGEICMEAIIKVDGTERNIICVNVFDDYIAERSRAATRYLQLVAYTAQIRNEICDIECQTLRLIVRTLGYGTVNKVLVMTEMHDPMLILGVLSRMILSGELVVDIMERPFGRHTLWRLA
ncbi:MAG: hypothetical protein ACRD6X_12375 [Pyrinomonadaceae bacterium]